MSGLNRLVAVLGWLLVITALTSVVLNGAQMMHAAAHDDYPQATFRLLLACLSALGARAFLDDIRKAKQ